MFRRHPFFRFWMFAFLVLFFFGCNRSNNPLVNLPFGPDLKIVRLPSVNDSALPGDLRKAYWDDAARLSLRLLAKFGGDSSNTVAIPRQLMQPIYNGLVLFYLSRNVYGYDQIYKIHTFPTPEIHRVVLKLDSNFAWVRNLQKGQIPTGNEVFDRLVQEYQLKLEEYLTHSMGHYATLFSPEPLNMNVLAVGFGKISGVIYAEPAGWMGDGSDIEVISNGEYWVYKYLLKWGDCPAGCINQHYWMYRIYPDGNVVFVGEGGDDLN